MAWSTNGINFNSPVIFQDSSGVPSMMKWKGDTLVCVFQWFRQPINSATWDKVAVKFSYNGGQNWTTPVPIQINGLPANFQRPFDPAIWPVNKDSIRIFYSSSNGMPVGGLDSMVNTYSAVSTDGIHYQFEPFPRFDHPNKPVIDPSAIRFNNQWHYLAPAGAPQDGAYHATSLNGINFIRQADFPSDNFHNWTGNYMIENSGELRFYGSGQNIWYSSSADGFIWQGYTATNLIGGDPAVTKTGINNYLAIYTGEPYNNLPAFKCGDTLIDPRDGKKYTTVLIGSDCWMKQNLNFGQLVLSHDSTVVHSEMFNNNIPEKYAMNNEPAKLNIYGGLYEWNELMNYTKLNAAQGLCPAGWHVSTDEEWKRLITVSGGQLLTPSAGVGGNALKKLGEGFGMGAGTDALGFSALHGGDRDGFGIFNGLNLRSIFWTSTSANLNQAFHYTLWAENDTLQRLMIGSNTGFACRCVKNPIANSVSKPLSNKEFLVYPNPFSKSIHISTEENITSIELFDSNGKILWKGEDISVQDFSFLSPGLYFMKIKFEHNMKLIKLIKE